MTKARPHAARSLACLSAAAASCVPWLACRFVGVRLPEVWAASLPGLCIFGAAFLLTWASEAAEMDLPQSLSVGILALIAVLPEYAVDMYFAWTAGKNPVYTAYATANMTGANRLLIGVGWPAVLLAAWWRRRSIGIRLSKDNAVEVVSLLAATLYSFFLPLKATLSLWDSLILMSLFALYTWRSSQAAVEEPALEGPAELIGGLPKLRRRLAVAGLFAASAAAIGLSAAPFAEGILAVGRHWGLEEFVLVQWLAPLASEAPEFIVSILFALKGRPEVGLRALVSSKVNQWTLLVGMIPVAYCASAHSLAAMPLDARQVSEIFLTSAQSLFGLALLMNMHFAMWEAVALLGLFAVQVAFPQHEARHAFAALYLVLAMMLMLWQEGRRSQIRRLVSHALRF